MSRKIEVALHIKYGDGTEGVLKVMQLPIPVDIPKVRNLGERDVSLENHARYVQSWLQKAIHRQIYEDSQPEAGMGSGCW